MNTPTPITDKANTAFTSLFAHDDAYWIPYVVGVKLERELTAVTEQRDRLLEQQEQWRLSSVCRELVEQRDEAREELKAVTEQRDKLAELSGFGEFDKPTEP